MGFIIGLFYLQMERGSASEMLFACNREVVFNGLNRTEFVVLICARSWKQGQLSKVYF